MLTVSNSPQSASIMTLQCWESLIGTMSVLHQVCLFTNFLSTKASKEALVGPCSETCILRCCHMNELAMTHSSKAIWGPCVGSKQKTSALIHHWPCHAQLSKVSKLTSPKHSQEEYPGRRQLPCWNCYANHSLTCPSPHKSMPNERLSINLQLLAKSCGSH